MSEWTLVDKIQMRSEKVLGEITSYKEWSYRPPAFIRSVERQNFEVVQQMGCLAYECKWSIFRLPFNRNIQRTETFSKEMSQVMSFLLKV